VVLPDYVNTNESVRVVKALIKTSDDGNWLVPNVPSGNWDEAIKYPEDNRFYEQARTAQLIVIGFSHTHPEIYNSAVRQSKSTITAHSEDDMRLYKKTKLPDIIISISVDAKWNSKFVKLELLSDYRYKKLPDLNEFLIKIENSIFNFIIKEYNHKII
jgi:proteasome lid subunit RPN8/RPN11